MKKRVKFSSRPRKICLCSCCLFKGLANKTGSSSSTVTHCWTSVTLRSILQKHLSGRQTLFFAPFFSHASVSALCMIFLHRGKHEAPLKTEWNPSLPPEGGHHHSAWMSCRHLQHLQIGKRLPQATNVVHFLSGILNGRKAAKKVRRKKKTNFFVF